MHKGYRHTKEAKQKISKALKGRKKEHNPWNKGLKGIYSEETKKRMSKSHKGCIPWNKGLKEVYSDETKRKMSEVKRGFKPSEETKRKMSEAHKGHNHTEETRKKISEANKGCKRSEEQKRKIIGEKNPNWKGGISKEPYPFGFNNDLKNQVKERDKHICQLCRAKTKLRTHHINYNKKDCRKENLITLCVSCNVKVNSMRDFWRGFFMGRIYERGKQMDFWE